ncbi:Vms1/Ankzf1 family peptidyl-tRNA hydrolase [Actinophytocola sp.]|uniref:Rv2629 family ribosome hibernation factor n=1 Tax=Actinophytocola sp. TaxID=1872138 RepID=UPI00389ACB08
MNLRRILDHPGPFATVHLDASHDTENADHELELRWRTARDELAAKGADEKTLAALEEVVREPAVGRAGRVLVAAGGEVLLDQWLTDPPPVPTARFGPLPYLLPLVELDAGRVPYVAAVVNKIGADVRAVDADGVVRTEHATDGEDYPVHKVRGGGWSALHIQRNVDQTVHRNALQVAEELARLVDDVGARLLAVGGDPQAVAELRSVLSRRCEDIFAEVPGRREADDDFDGWVSDLAAERARAEQEALVERFAGAVADADGLAVRGLAEATAALREHNAEAVVLGDVADATVWVGAEPMTVALTEDELRATGVEQATEVRADEALPAFGVLVGAEVVSTRGLPVEDGVGVLLRHA